MTLSTRQHIKHTFFLVTGLMFSALQISTLQAAESHYPVQVQSCDRTVTFNQAPKAAIPNDSNLPEMMLVDAGSKHCVNDGFD